MDEKLKPLAASLQPLIASSNACAPSTNLRQASEAYATERARLLFGQFRRGEANDAETYVASIAAALSVYPDDVMRQATDPRTGIAAHQDWLPTVHEVHAECREIVEAEARARQRERDLHHQMAGRAQYEAVRARAPTRAEIRAKLGPKPPVDALAPDALYAKLRAARAMHGDRLILSDETRAILTSAGYSV